ncbi:protein kinase C alpha type [Biomphalaria glabrata]|uniref:Serine/threonine-protein kinase Sgk2-like isoform X1 n=2 Tax=Biomphalaria glabrata TaxID=6526 RepID=A0A9W3ABA1_BIOGL|nr:serine/threonine-protein kinase Sgk2-like isoform X1 [Biomphalaria glabrata]XP_055884464.1 serine/threonine-protein kinase Sgk2-like isoform X1 [Biomphalaria glabrata]
MACFKGCFGNRPPVDVKRRRPSAYGVITDLDIKDGKTRNALNIKLQMEITEVLSEATYGLTPEGVDSSHYEAQDFFAFKEILGSGATGVVFRAVFKPSGQVFAVKFIPNFRQIKVMVIRELTVLKFSSLCKYLIGFHSHFRVDTNMYFVMELCEGGTLEDLLEPKHLMPPKLARIYLKEISSALFFLHRMRIVHRDVYLANCLLTSTAHLKLCDFGLCRTVDDPQGEMMTDCGKPWIRAPEMYLDKPCSFGIDWWSVGILLYRFITGCNPFNCDKLTQGYQSVTKLKEKYPEWLFTDKDALDLCQKLLIKEPKRRLCAENEIHDIKSHSYFMNIDWNEIENMADIIEQEMLGDVERYLVVIARMSSILGINTENLAANVTKARGSVSSLERGDKTKMLSNALKKIMPMTATPLNGDWSTRRTTESSV